MSYLLTYNSEPFHQRITLSGSKSESNRALIIRHLCGENFHIENLSNADDTRVLQDILANIHNETSFDVGHAGTAMRFLTALFSVTEGERILKGSERMHQRPIKLLVDALRSIGANISYLEKDGYPPLKIQGKPLQGGEISIRGDVSSQYLSALVMIAPYLENGLTLNIISEFTSKPYLQMTLNMMRYFGAEVEEQEQTIRVKKGNYFAKNYVVESDWSSASYWYGALAFAKNSTLELIGLKHENSMQPDAIVKELYEAFGVKTTPIKGGVQLSKYAVELPQKVTIDFSNFPDIAQTLACSFVGFQTRGVFTGLHTLRIKETDRIEALKNELQKVGATVSSTSDSLSITEFNKATHPAEISTYDDHRMAMAFAIMVFVYGKIIIQNPEVVTKSYPNFWNDLKLLGVDILER
jgi:3-phosphoshikimate 1-carboxyvinyltransferase